MPTGKFAGHVLWSEASWKLVNGTLSVHRRDGVTAAIAHSFVRGVNGQFEIQMIEPNNQAKLKYTLVAREIYPSDPIAYPFTITWRHEFETIFIRHNIYLRHVMQIKGVWPEGKLLRLDAEVLVEPFATMPTLGFCSMGSYSYSAGSQLPNALRIGRYSSIAPDVVIIGLEHQTDWFTTSPVAYAARYSALAQNAFGKSFKTEHSNKPNTSFPIIGNDVWIGQRASLRRGIKIGDGAIIGAGAVVVNDVPPYAIVGGVPARIIRWRFTQPLIERLLKISWWRFNYVDLPQGNYQDVEGFVDRLEETIASGLIHPFTPAPINIAQILTDHTAGKG